MPAGAARRRYPRAAISKTTCTVSLTVSVEPRFRSGNLQTRGNLRRHYRSPRSGQTGPVDALSAEAIWPPPPSPLAVSCRFAAFDDKAARTVVDRRRVFEDDGSTRASCGPPTVLHMADGSWRRFRDRHRPLTRGPPSKRTGERQRGNGSPRTSEPLEPQDIGRHLRMPHPVHGARLAGFGLWPAESHCISDARLDE